MSKKTEKIKVFARRSFKYLEYTFELIFSKGGVLCGANFMSSTKSLFKKCNLKKDKMRVDLKELISLAGAENLNPYVVEDKTRGNLMLMIKGRRYKRHPIKLRDEQGNYHILGNHYYRRTIFGRYKSSHYCYNPI